MAEKIIVTSYIDPDADGVGCSYAYAEYLQKSGKNAMHYIFGKPHREAQFVLDKFDIRINKRNSIIGKDIKVILVDTSDLDSAIKIVNPKQIVEIIDHRKFNEKENFPSASTQIELVGSCATLISEKFYDNNVPISKESSILLYSAIVSNTLNFMGNVTTDRDKKMAEWLKTKIRIPKNYIEEMFNHKSNFTQPLKEVLLADFKNFDINNKRVGIAQLEIMNVDAYISKNIEESKKILSEIKKDKKLDYIFLNCIDLKIGNNCIIIIDEFSKKMLEKSLNIKFIADVAKTKNILMRKEIVPLLKDLT